MRLLLISRFLPTVLVAFLVYEVLLTSLEGKYPVWLTVASVFGLGAMLYLNFQWRDGRLSASGLVIWSAAVPFALALVALFVRATSA